MRAALCFATTLTEEGLVPERIRCDLHGSLSLTGKGHGTDVAILLGLAGDDDHVCALLREAALDRTNPNYSNSKC